MKHLVIPNCSECPFYEEDHHHGTFFCTCTKTKKTIPFTGNYNIPDWCPLEEIYIPYFEHVEDGDEVGSSSEVNE